MHGFRLVVLWVLAVHTAGVVGTMSAARSWRGVNRERQLFLANHAPVWPLITLGCVRDRGQRL
jgi:hypothetical protein